ncbi:MAG: acyl-CoA dehydrogenase family protein, partial [Dehalococcoidia bacterium]
MEFRFTAEQEAFRAELKGFLRESVPDGAGPVRPTSQEGWPGQLEFLNRLAARKWVAPAWPAEYGGLGWGHLQQMIFSE